MMSFSLINNWFSLVTLISATGLWFGAPFFLRVILPGFNPYEIQQSTAFFRILVLFMPIRIFNGMCSIPFRANKIYTVHERTGMVKRLIVIVLLLVVTDRFGVKLLIFGTILGTLIRFLYILYLFKKHGYRYQFLLRSKRFTVKWILGKVYIPFLQTLFLQVNRWIAIGVLTLLPQGLLAVFQYVQQFYTQFSSILMKSFGTVFLTDLSADTNLYNRDRIQIYLKKNLLIYFSSLILIICAGRDILQLIWGSSKFGLHDISIAYVFLVIFVISMFFEMLRSIYLKLDVARGNIAYQYIGSMVIQMISSIILILTVRMFGFYALIVRILFRAIAQAMYAIYINYHQSKKSFIFYSKQQLLKGLLHSGAVILIIYGVFSLSRFEFDLNKASLACVIGAKVLTSATLFLAINKYLKVYELKFILKG